MRSKHYRTCPLCEAVCGLEIAVEDGRVTRVAGDREDVFSRGFICPKGASLGALHTDPDRLRRPLVRSGGVGDFREVSWEEAFAEVERLLPPILAEDRQAVALYAGNPNAHNLSGMHVRPLTKALGTHNVFSASTVDQMPKELACALMFGRPLAVPVPDLDRTDLLIMLGANPWESNGSLCTAPDFPGRLEALRARGGRLVVVDPRRTRTADDADQHITIRPGTDAHLLLGMIRVLFDEGRVRLGRLAPFVNGVEAVAKAVQPFSPQAVERRTGVPAQTIQDLARSLSGAERAVVYGRIGTHTTDFGTLAAWAVDVLNVLTGHLDEPGGAMWALPAHTSRRTPGPGRGFEVGRRHSRVKGYPEVRGEFPCVTLADEIETPGPGQVRALITVAGNPVLSNPDGERLARALATLPCVICVDPYVNETTRHAHVILPPPSPLEKSHYDMVFYGLAVRNVAKWSAPVLPQEGLDESDILARLGLIAAGMGAAADLGVVHEMLEQTLLAQAMRDSEGLTGRSIEDLRSQLAAEQPLDRAVEILVRTGAYGDQFGARPGGLTFDKLRAAPHGIDLGPLVSRVPELLETPSGKIELAPERIIGDVPRLATALADLPGPGLLLVGRRDLRSNNSWMHNLRPLIKGPERCTLQMHPQDASGHGLADGQDVRVTANVGSVVIPLQVTDRVMPGVVSLPHGYGHSASGSRLRVASERPGVNSNLLSDAGRLDPLSGNATLTAIPVTVAPA
ncbi:MAG: molybdopterin-dependent oxidoreductase [Myxococcales bacterium]|nr:molybdopterin-dependent oxidoreductase [Myxococcales bacterium]